MPELTEAELRRHLSAESFGNLYVIWGEEKYLVKRAARRLIRKAGGETFPEFNCQELGNDSTVDAIAEAAEALPFFTERKCVAVSDFDLEEKSQAELSKLYELLGQLPESTVLVFWYPTLHFEGKKSAKWRNFLKQANAVGFSLSCGQREASELRKLLIREAEKSGCILLKEEASLLVDYVGRDLNALLREIEKLCAFAAGTVGGEGPWKITREMVEALAPKNAETTVFLMVNALLGENYEKAYLLMDQLFYQNEEPIAILGALASVYVDMYRVRAALQGGLSSSAPAEYGEYKGKEFRLRNAERNGKNLSNEALCKSLDLLLETDLLLKGSPMDARVLMDELIAKLLLAVRGERL